MKSTSADAPRAADSGSPVSVAILGLGTMGRRHLTAFRSLGSNCSVAAVFDVDPNAIDVARAQRILDDRVVVAESAEAAISRANLVVIATPAQTHATLIEHALRASRHVLVEKPLTLHAPEAAAVVELARKQRVELFVGMNERFNPSVVWLRETLEELEANQGEQLLGLDLIRLGPSPSSRVRSSHELDILTELAVHDLDLSTVLCRAALASVSRVNVDRANPAGSQNLHATLRGWTTSNVCVCVEASWQSMCKTRRITATTSHRRIVVDLLTGAVETHWNDERPDTIGSVDSANAPGRRSTVHTQAEAVRDHLNGRPSRRLAQGAGAGVLLRQLCDLRGCHVDGRTVNNVHRLDQIAG